jgi:hypothetical protein
MSESGPKLRQTMSGHMSAIEGITGLVVLTLSFFESDPKGLYYWDMAVFPDGPIPVTWIMTSPSFAHVKWGAFGGSE